MSKNKKIQKQYEEESSRLKKIRKEELNSKIQPFLEGTINLIKEKEGQLHDNYVKNATKNQMIIREYIITTIETIDEYVADYQIYKHLYETLTIFVDKQNKNGFTKNKLHVYEEGGIGYKHYNVVLAFIW
jgi:hypothetical protein